MEVAKEFCRLWHDETKKTQMPQVKIQEVAYDRLSTQLYHVKVSVIQA